MRSIRPGEAGWAEHGLRPWYGTANMETDAPPVTGCGGGPIWRSARASKDQEKLWDARCYVELRAGGQSGVVSRKFAAHAAMAERILGRKLHVEVVN